MTHYIVTVKKGTDINAFYDEMETPGGSSTIPDREVTCYDRKPISRNTGYDLEDSEVELLLNDDRVLGIDRQSLVDSIKIRPSWTQTSTDWDKGSSISNTNKNWGLYRCTRGSQVANWGSDGTVDASDTITITSSGKNVDVLVVDGHLDTGHPEFAVNADGTGGTRVQQFNWFSLTNEVNGGSNGTYPYRSGASLDNANDNHGMHVAGTVAGNTQGWARDSNIYYISPYGGEGISDGDLFEYVLAWHRQKSVNPETGRVNPTICNNSWGSFYQIARSSITSLTYRGTTDSTVPFSDGDLDGYGLVYYDASDVFVQAYLTSLVADIEDCIDAGIIFVGAAGNDSTKIDVEGGSDFNNYVTSGSNYYYHRGSWNTSAARSGVGGQRLSICVGAVSALVNESKATFTNCGPRVDIFSPGDNIISPVNDGTVNGGSVTTVTDPRNASYNLAKYDGTSMASPQVCGVLACLLEQYPNMNQSDIENYLTQHKKTGQMTETNGGYTDNTDLQGAGNDYLFYFKERSETGVTIPRYTHSSRKSTTDGVKYPRTNRTVTLTNIVGDLIYTISNSGTSFNLKSTGDVNYTVVWGDGSRENSTSNDLSHTYSSSGTYQVKIKSNSGYYQPYFNNSTEEDQLISVAIGATDVLGISFDRSFYGAQNMTEYTQEFEATSNVTNFEYTWRQCSGITTFPQLDTSSGTNFYGTWASCSGLTTFPSINVSSGTTFYQCWQGCTGLTTFPQLDTSSGTDFSFTWYDCSSLTSFPQLDVSSGTNFTYTWYSCTGLTTFPQLNTSSGTNFSLSWSNCTGLTTFPQLDTSNGTNFSFAWRDCTGLTSFPQLDTSSGTDFSNAWNGCTGIITFPQLNVSSGTNFNSAWFNCSGITSFPLLNTSSGTNFSFTWYNCSSLTSFPQLDVSSGTNFFFAWQNCSGLTSFPQLDVSSGTNFYGTWYSCTGLTTFPQLNTSSGTNFYQCWQGCTGLTTFPQLDTSSGTEFSFAWYNCSSLTSFPQLDTSSGTKFSVAWYGCSGLTTFPQLNVSSGTNFNKSWQNCSNLVGFPTGMFDTSTSTNYQFAWQNCALNAQSIENILVSLDTAGQSNGFLNVDFGTNANASTWTLDAIDAHTILEDRSWTIGQNGTVEIPVLVYDIDTEAQTASNTDFNLRLTGITSTYDVNWGDGNIDVDQNSATLLHSYSTPGTYTITITGNPKSRFSPYNNNFGADVQQILGLSTSTTKQRFTDSLNSAWQGCSGITTFPQLDTSSVTDFGFAWRDCSGLTSFPQLDTSSVTDFNNAWYYCSGITTFPQLNTSSGTNFSSAWRACFGLTSFPQLDVSSGTDFSNTWDSCTGLTTFPQLDVSSGTNFTSTWRGCSGITTFPQLDTSSGTSFSGTWQNCSNLVGFPTGMFDTCTATNFINAWNNCGLGITAIESILVSLDTAGQSNGTLDFNGGTSASYSDWTTAAKTAYNNLVGIGWTIDYNT